MKRIALVSAIALGALFTKTADAQIGINVGLRVGNAPVYAPAAQVDVNDQDEYNSDDYYYLPDVDAYYDIVDQCYFYNDGYNWVSAAYLPGYANYDWRNFRRYEIRGRRPYLRNDYYRGQYSGRVGNWGRVDERAYADRNFRRDENRFDNRGFDNRENWNRGQTERFNTPRDFRQYNNDRFNNRENRGGEQQTERFNTPRQFEQPQQNNGGRGNFGGPQNGGRGAMGGNGFAQPAQPNLNQRGNNAPAQSAPESRGQWGQHGGGQQHIVNNGNGGMNNRFGR